MSLQAGQSVAHYRVVEKIGAGGMGEVWRAEDTRLHRDVALKVLPEAVAADPERMGRFEREAHVLASLNHPHVGAIYGIEHAGAMRVLVLELVAGQDLSQRMEAGAAVTTEEALRLAEQIASGLEAAHARGIIHRDLKPANVKVTPEGVAKVLDFGLAKATLVDGGVDANLSLSPTLTVQGTQDGMILGTAAYMAPEQARGRPVDRRADVWAFGVLLFELLTGKPLFRGETVTDVLAAVVRAEPGWELLPAALPAGIRRLLRRCLAKDPERRLRDIGDVRLEILEALEGTPEDDAGGAPERQPVPAWRRALPWAAALLLGAAGLAGGLALRGDADQGRVLQASILPPPGRTFQLVSSRPGSPQLSPDGSMVAFSARGEDGEVLLHLRRLDAPEAQALDGTEEAQYPFWSPDSRHVGFFTRKDGTLKKIAVGGGPPVTLCAAPNGKGGTWSRDGTIVFAPSFDTALYRVRAGGGEPEAVTEFAPDSAFDSHRLPFFLPDGDRFLYLAKAASGNAAENEIRVASLADGTTETLFQADGAAEYASGYLLFARERTLLARSFDPGTLALGEDSVPVAPSVTILPNTGKATFSVSTGGSLIYLSGVETPLWRLRWVDREGTPGGLLGDEAVFGSIALSPDGAHLVASIDDPTTGQEDLWVYELARGLRTRFTFEAGDEGSPVWSPDGEHVYYAHATGGGANIKRKAVGGTGEAEVVLESRRLIFPSGIAPGEDLLLVMTPNPDSQWDVMSLPLAGTDPPELRPVVETPFIDGDGCLSPDGRWLAYISLGSGRAEVFVQPFPGPGRKWQISTEGGDNPLWSIDGRRLYYVDPDSRLNEVSLQVQEGSLEVGAPVPLFRVERDPRQYTYAAAGDGRFLILEPTREAVTPPASLVLNWPATLQR